MKIVQNSAILIDIIENFDFYNNIYGVISFRETFKKILKIVAGGARFEPPPPAKSWGSSRSNIEASICKCWAVCVYVRLCVCLLVLVCGTV